MASLLSSEFKPVKRDRLYFDKFRYCVAFTMPELYAVRQRTHASIDLRLDHRVKYAQWVTSDPSNRTSWSVKSNTNELTKIAANGDTIRKDCHHMLNFLDMCDENKLIISINWGYFYTNSLSDAHDLVDLPYVKTMHLTQADVNRPRGTLKFRNNPHNYRSYFRSQMLTEDQKLAVATYLNTETSITKSPALAAWIGLAGLTKRYGTWAKQSFFVDYNNESDVTMLLLAVPKLFRKTLPIVKSTK